MNIHTMLRRAGSTSVEFALVLITFLTFFLFIVDMSRLAYAVNVGTEATLLGARYAIVCADKTDADLERVQARMQALMPEISEIDIEWVDAEGTPDTCTVNDCAGVIVRVTDLNFDWLTPMLGAVVLPSRVLPEFTTYLPRESMRQDDNSDDFCTETL